MLKWAIALLIEYVISQPIMVWVEMHLLHKVPLTDHLKTRPPATPQPSPLTFIFSSSPPVRRLHPA
jgi:hypothetical protein